MNVGCPYSVLFLNFVFLKNKYNNISFIYTVSPLLSSIPLLSLVLTIFIPGRMLPS